MLEEIYPEGGGHDMTVDKTQAKARALESSEIQAKGMEDTAAQSIDRLIESVRQVRRSQHPPGQTQNHSQQKSSTHGCQCGLT